jgi:hypothetical protein
MLPRSVISVSKERELNMLEVKLIVPDVRDPVDL